jgi:prevent-host-death family protein
MAIKIALNFLGGGCMKVANTVELKNKTNKLLRQVMKGEPLIITYRGKPAASITPLSEDDLEDFVLEHSPKVRKMIAEAEADRKTGRVIPLEVYLSKQSPR